MKWYKKGDKTMKKMNYSNFKDNTEIVPVTSVEVIDSSAYKTLSTESARKDGIGSLANISPPAAIASVINTALGTISDISKCIALVSFEKQRTKQIQAQANAQIEESIQQTKRIKIQEQETTKRLIIQCKADLAKKEIELRSLCEANRSREVELIKNHDLYLEQLNDLDKIVENIMNDKNVIHQMLISEIEDRVLLESLLHSLNDINAKLVDISREIVGLKRG